MTGQDGKGLFLRRILPCALFLCGVALLLFLEKAVAGEWGFPFDDSWIFAQYARHLAEGQGFCFNRGEPSSGFTSFLWVLLCALGYKLTGAFGAPMKVMGVLFGVGSVIVTQRIIAALTNDATKARWCRHLTALFPPLIANALAGMEESPYVFTALLGVWMHLRWRGHRHPDGYGKGSGGAWAIWGNWGRYLLPAYLMVGWVLAVSLSSARWLLF
ncbi:hypothetical protein HRbin17_00847 [bacterium HR17]|uniref:Glycosyltransferase RgtA/B/C/D-like domain-containing protein n=1 Tax=Candidatus Fervidibacter japonicus TaxID=2035412 RepID=A0A2H5XAZ7_9BACT|nr:hypothetical protein HRbin17_00847 [bacterium HR17]